VCDVDRNC